MPTNEIRMIPIEKLMHHPDNPRQDIGDVSELAASIQAKGIMQNLTVLPAVKLPTGTEMHYVVIGNRRLEAAKIAGATHLPCVIRDLTPQEAMAVMLAENMQRVDLTIPEQVAGIQMCLDLGMSDEDIRRETGFSKKTYSQRKKLTGIDSKALKSGMEKGLTLEDWLLLEDIPDEEAKVRLIAEIAAFEGDVSGLRADIKSDHEDACNRKFIDDVMNPYMERIHAIEGDPWEVQYYPDYTRIAEYRLCGRKNSRQDFEHVMEEARKEHPLVGYQMYEYCVNRNGICILAVKEEAPKEKPKTEEEIKKEEAQKKKYKLAQEQQRLIARLKRGWIEWIRNNLNLINYADTSHFPECDAAILKCMLNRTTFFNYSCRHYETGNNISQIDNEDMVYMLEGVDVYTNTKARMSGPATNSTISIPEIRVLVCQPRYFYVCVWLLETTYTWSPFMQHDSKLGTDRFSRSEFVMKQTKEFYEALCSLGYPMTDDEKMLINGTHPLLKSGGE